MNDLDIYNDIIYSINNNNLQDVIYYYNDNTKYFSEKLDDVSKCLSVNKQKQIAKVMNINNIKYKIHYPNKIKEALDIRNILPNDYNDKDFFELVDFFCSQLIDLFNDNDLFETQKKTLTEIENDENIWIKIYNWFLNNNSLSDYNILTNIIPLVSSDFRMLMLKRYLHDIRLKNTSYNENILIQFRDSFNEKFIILRQCMYENEWEKHLITSLLADCILNTKESEGKNIETFNGILDLITQKSNENNPSLSMLNYFLPICEGAILNNNFEGFIKYDVICKLDENKLSDYKYIKNVIYKVLKKCNAHKDDNTNSWNFMNYQDNVKYINMFYSKRIICPSQMDNNPKYEKVTINEYDFDFQRFITKIREYCQYNKNDFNTFIIESKNYTIKNIYIWIISQFCYPLYVEVYPNSNIICGMEYDIFRIKNDIIKSAKDEKEIKDNFMFKESLIIQQLIKDALDKDFNLISLLKFDYRKNILQYLITKYFCKTKYSIYGKLSSCLVDTHKEYIFCAPKLSDKKQHEILNIPFYWCKSKQCFYPEIQKQLLKNSKSWANYNLYQLLEIIGYPMIEYKNDFPTTKKTIRNFIGLINKINKILPHLKCDSCGHLLFPSNNGASRNDYHYFYCKNTKCRDNNKKIYINKCYNCSKIVDSRRSKKCKNNNVICPECLSCCNDEMFKSIKITFEQGGIQQDWLTEKLGKGHNDKNIFFCPKCGTQLENKKNSESKVCKTCNITYNKTPEHYGRTFIYKASKSNEYENINITR